MKWLLTFLFGMVAGAGTLFVVLRAVPDEPLPPTAGIPASSGVPAEKIDPLLPGAPLVQADLTEVDLPLRPAAQRATASVASTAPAAAATAAVQGRLLVPVQGIEAASLADTYDQRRGSDRHHEALDIMAAKGTPVLAATDGKIEKLFSSKTGGTTLYQFDPSGKYAYYYAHLDRYADGVKEGMAVRRGDVLGYVGVSGNADPETPHLHFAVFELTPEKKWWQGTPIDPLPLIAH
jgi:peptidoglycan LD-endopeptidase LytH